MSGNFKGSLLGESKNSLEEVSSNLETEAAENLNVNAHTPNNVEEVQEASKASCLRFEDSSEFSRIVNDENLKYILYESSENFSLYLNKLDDSESFYQGYMRANIVDTPENKIYGVATQYNSFPPDIHGEITSLGLISHLEEARKSDADVFGISRIMGSRIPNFEIENPEPIDGSYASEPVKNGRGLDKTIYVIEKEL